jgi:hypothetical protein
MNTIHYPSTHLRYQPGSALLTSSEQHDRRVAEETFRTGIQVRDFFIGLDNTTADEDPNAGVVRLSRQPGCTSYGDGSLTSGEYSESTGLRAQIANSESGETSAALSLVRVPAGLLCREEVGGQVEDVLKLSDGSVEYVSASREAIEQRLRSDEKGAAGKFLPIGVGPIAQLDWGIPSSL